MNPTQNIETSNSLDIQNENINTEQSTEELFNSEQELLDSITNPLLKEQAQEEFDEMVNNYETQKETFSSETQMLLSDLKEEFRNDLESLNVLIDEDIKELVNFDHFMEVVGELDNNTEEKLFSILDNAEKDDIFEIFERLIDDLDSIDDMGEDFVLEFIDELSENLGLKEIEKYKELPIDQLSTEEINYHINEISNILKITDNHDLRELLLKLKGKNKITILPNSNDNQNNFLKEIEEQKVKEEEQKAKEEEKKAKEEEKKAISFNNYCKDLSIKNEKLNGLIKDLLAFENNKTKKIDNLKGHLDKAKEIADYIIEYPESLDSLPTEIKNDFIDKLVSVTKYIDGYDTSKLEALKIKTDIEESKRSDFQNLSNTTTLKAKNGAYKLDINFDMEKINNPKKLMSYAERAEFAKNKLELRGEIKEMKTKAKELYKGLQEKKGEEKEIRDKIENLKKWPTVESKKEIEKEEIKLGRVLIEKKDLKQKVDSRTAMIEAKQNELNILIKDFNAEIQKRLDIKLKELKEAEKNRKDNLDFLERTGFTVFSNSTINPALGYINKYPASLGLHGKIDLVKGEFGESGMDGQEKGREVFIRLFNKMISGNPDEPITDISGVVKGTNNILKDRNQAMEMLKKYNIDPNTTGISHKLIENLKKQPNKNGKDDNIENIESVKNEGTV